MKWEAYGFVMKLPAAAYSAEVATSDTKAGSYRVFSEGESSRWAIDEVLRLARATIKPWLPISSVLFISSSIDGSRKLHMPYQSGKFS